MAPPIPLPAPISAPVCPDFCHAFRIAALVHEVHADDQYLLNTIDGEWFEILHHFPWQDHHHHAAAYYDALYEFNREERDVSKGSSESTPETKEAAKQRLLFARATMQPTPAQAPQMIYQGQVVTCESPTVDPMSLAPGVVPPRLLGRKPKCFFGLLKSYGHGTDGFSRRT